MSVFRNSKTAISQSVHSEPFGAEAYGANRRPAQILLSERSSPFLLTPAHEIAPENWSVGLDPPLRFSLGFVNRVVVKEVNSLRDLIESLPALRAVRLAFEGAKLSVLVKKELASIFDGMGWVDEVIPYTAAREGRRWGGHRKIVKQIRARRFDLAIIFARNFTPALWVTLARVPRRAGYATDRRGFLLTHKAAPPPADSSGSQINPWLRMISDTLGVAPIAHAQHHLLEVDNDNRNKMRAWLTKHGIKRELPLIAIAPFASYGKAREWPPARFAALINWIAIRCQAQCILLSANSDRDRCKTLATEVGPSAIATADDTSIGELTALLSLCDGFVGNDTGVMHLAAAIGLPTVGILGSTNPARFGPPTQGLEICRELASQAPCPAT
jgi:heptosyltransferase II